MALISEYKTTDDPDVLEQGANNGEKSGGPTAGLPTIGHQQPGAGGLEVRLPRVQCKLCLADREPSDILTLQPLSTLVLSSSHRGNRLQ
jgi:hypothetical protein